MKQEFEMTQEEMDDMIMVLPSAVYYFKSKQ